MNATYFIIYYQNDACIYVNRNSNTQFHGSHISKVNHLSQQKETSLLQFELSVRYYNQESNAHITYTTRLLSLTCV